jgi:succinyl-CoA synthetase beta subunit
MSTKNVISKNGVWKTAPLSGGVLVVHNEDGTLDKTWQEIKDAIVGGTPCFIMTDADDTITIALVTEVFTESGTYYANVVVENTDSHIEYMSSSADGYPAAE